MDENELIKFINGKSEQKPKPSISPPPKNPTKKSKVSDKIDDYDKPTQNADDEDYNSIVDCFDDDGDFDYND